MCVALHNTRARLILAVATLAFAIVAGIAPASADAQQLRGAQLHSLWPSTPIEDAEREVDMLASTGANAVRIDISWSSIETESKGSRSPWYLQKADRIFKRANERGLKIVAVFWGTPCWASAAPESLRQDCEGAWWDRAVDRYAPRDMTDFGDAAAFVADRWGSQLAAIEIWNEPNLADQYQLHADNPALTAAQFQRTAYPRIKAEAPNLPVLAGVLSGSDGEFLEKLYRYGIGGHHDGISIHPYNESRDPDNPFVEEWKQWSFLRGVPWIHRIMSAHGDGDKGVWLTEFGFPTCSDGDKWCVNQQQQAEYIKDSFRIARRWDFVKAALMYNLRNNGTSGGREQQYGLLNRDFSPKPSWNSFREAMADQGGAETGRDAEGAEATAGDSTLRVAARGSVTVSKRGVTPVRVACPATASRRCAGTVTVQTKPIRRGKRKRKRKIRLGSRRVRVAPGRAKIVKIRIPARHRPLLKKLRRVRVRVTVAAYTQLSTARASKRKAGLTLRTHRIRV